MSTSVFFDTNIWVHYRPISNIDWRTILGDDEIDVVVPPIVIDELDKLKDSASNRRVQDRARAALKLIESWDTDGSRIRESVFARTWYSSGPLGTETLGLDPARADDILIATICAFRSAHPNKRVVLITGDTGPRLKAKRYGLEAIAGPEQERLTEPDPLETENKRLRNEIQKLSNRYPRLIVAFRDGVDGGNRLVVHPLVAQKVTETEFVAGALATARAKAPERLPKQIERAGDAPKKPQRKNSHIFDLSALTNTPYEEIPADEYERYSRDRDQYLESISKTAKKQWARDEELSRSVVVSFTLRNEGTDVASDIDVALHVPDGPQVFEWSKLKPLEVPEPPIPPRTYRERFSESMRASSLAGLRIPSFNHFPEIARQPPNVSVPRIRESESYEIEYHVGRLKHHDAVRLGDLRFAFASRSAVRNLTVSWQIRSASLAEIVEGQLHLVVST